MKEQRIQSTNQYTLFGTIGSNREVDKKHVKRLAAAISENNLLHLNPIIVNSEMQVIDGQHRLQAAKLLNVPIFYVTDDGVNKGHIAALNTNQKNWATMDYVNYWQREKRPGFRDLAKFINNSGLPVSAAVSLLAFDPHGALKSMREGRVDTDNIEMANDIIDFIHRVAEQYGYDWFICGGVAKSLRRMWEHPEFDSEKLWDKIATQPRSVVLCTSDKKYLEMFAEIYNYKVQYRIDFFSRRKEDSDG
jgi:hypothetical protein